MYSNDAPFMKKKAAFYATPAWRRSSCRQAFLCKMEEAAVVLPRRKEIIALMEKNILLTERFFYKMIFLQTFCCY